MDKEGVTLNFILELIISYFTSYLVIWLHELGHAFFYWKYGCKDNLFKITVKPYLFFSTPAPVNEEKSNLLTQKQDLMISYAGIIMNLIFAFLAYEVKIVCTLKNSYFELFIYEFITLHLAEVISYLVLGNIYLVSDMKNIAEIKPMLRPLNFIIGLLISIKFFQLIRQVPDKIFYVVLIINLLVIFCMGLGRIVFTYYYSKKTINN